MQLVRIGLRSTREGMSILKITYDDNEREGSRFAGN